MFQNWHYHLLALNTKVQPSHQKNPALPIHRAAAEQRLYGQTTQIQRHLKIL